LDNYFISKTITSKTFIILLNKRIKKFSKNCSAVI